MDQSHTGLVRVNSVASAFQDAGVSAFQTKREDVVSDIGPSFVDDADDTERNAHAAQTKPVLQRTLLLYHA